MCVAVPGKLIEIEDGQGKADVRGNVLSVELGIVDAKIGDWLLIHAGCAISVINQAEADEINGLLDIVDEYGN